MDFWLLWCLYMVMHKDLIVFVNMSDLLLMVKVVFLHRHWGLSRHGLVSSPDIHFIPPVYVAEIKPVNKEERRRENHYMPSSVVCHTLSGERSRAVLIKFLQWCWFFHFNAWEMLVSSLERDGDLGGIASIAQFVCAPEGGGLNTTALCSS